MGVSMAWSHAPEAPFFFVLLVRASSFDEEGWCMDKFGSLVEKGEDT
jgi:hypothetical protein